jgi:O-acetyl-ADP-ribose deacetylase (regulator of RNase III)
MGDITVVEGDITLQDVDVIVNAANSSLFGGGGVDGAIHRKGGREILAECRKIRAERYPEGLPPGQAVSTGAGRLPAGHVVHVVGPVWSPKQDRSALLASCYREALRLADRLGARSIAFPAISTGIYGYPLPDAAKVAIAAIRSTPTALEEIRLVAYSPEAYEVFRQALNAAESEATGSSPGP